MSDSKMLINYVPGEECRVAIVEDGKLEEYHVERFATASRVGNIYVGKVTNVEPAIQAAFVDFGVGENGFLHVSDIHPRYFPGEEEDTTERVGFKTPRRDRPPIQQCLRRGDEVIVQVLKEGVGTKGPTLTSYLSIPGRFLVMMPHMDRTGVSRKVEDEDQRRKMREILDQLELPENFGFIVRTAGMDRTKVELKRDLAYLQRLWKDMERRRATGDRARLLYSESDLLVRSLRDLLTTEITEVVIDHEVALRRAARFMKIVAPRGQARLLQHTTKTPVFHAFGVEQQIALIHAREVPLPSGGRLVIDQTEALVAIDVNSGKSRESRDSETNAYQTNLEAVDEICRQLRLRDMGGIIINDLIDMRHASHRKDIEQRFKDRLKRDRARSTVIPISEFGILEMTRQRMRPSHESIHFTDCPVCRGRGMVQRPDSLAGDALRDLAAVLDVEKIAKVEMVVAPRVAGELLSTKRLLLNRIERASGKHVDVRVSEQVALDRVTFYAYDAQGADVDLTNLPKPKSPRDLKEWDIAPEGDWAMDEQEEKAAVQEPDLAEPVEEEIDLHPIERADLGEAVEEETNLSGGTPPSGEGERGGRRRRRRGRGRGRGNGEQPARDNGPRGQPREGAPIHVVRPPADRTPHIEAKPVGGESSTTAFAGFHGDEDGAPMEAPASGAPEIAPEHGSDSPVADNGQGPTGEGGGRRRRRRRRGRRGRGGGGPGGEQLAPGEALPSVPLVGDPNSPGVIRPQDRAQPYEEHIGEHAGEPGDETSLPEHPDSGADTPNGPAQGEGDGGGRRRRRRRGRRGRGGGGGGGGGGGSGGGGGGDGGRAQQGAPGGSDRGGDRQPQGGQPRGQRGGGYRNTRYPKPTTSSGDRGSAGGAPEQPKQPPAASNAPDSAPKPRLLYAAGRRKLNPSELNRRPKPE